MGRDATHTRERLLDAAQHLFARRGVDAVAIREINELAGQRNASALHYHFGSRQGLLVAIVERHQPAIDARRAELVAVASDEPRQLIDALLRPLIDHLQTSEGRDYLRIVPQLLGPGHTEGLPSPPALATAMHRLERHLDAWGQPVRAERLRSMLLTTTTLLADRAARLEASRRLPTSQETFAEELVAMATGLLLAPPSPGRRTTRADAEPARVQMAAT